jgi:hypothetical protein
MEGKYYIGKFKFVLWSKNAVFTHITHFLYKVEFFYLYCTGCRFYLPLLTVLMRFCIICIIYKVHC